MTPPSLDFDEYMARLLKAHPELEETLKAARRRLAPLLYPDCGRDYQRMMRGEPPTRPLH